MMHKSVLLIAALGFGLALLNSRSLVQAQDSTTDQASQEIQAALTELRDAKKAFLEARQNAATANRDETGQRRAELNQKRLENRQATLLRILDLHQKHLEKTKERIQGMPNVDEASLTDAVAKIDQALATVADLKSQVENAAADESLKRLAQLIRTELQNYKAIVKSGVDAIHASRLTVLLTRANTRAASLAESLVEVSAAGEDVSSRETSLNQAQDLLATAEAQRSGNEFRAAVRSMKDAYALMRQVFQSF